MALIPERLKDAGYATHFVGKWHVGANHISEWPLGRRFDTSLGFHSKGIHGFKWLSETGSFLGNDVTDIIRNDTLINVTADPLTGWRRNGFYSAALEDFATMLSHLRQGTFAAYKAQVLQPQEAKASHYMDVFNQEISRILASASSPFFIYYAMPMMRDGYVKAEHVEAAYDRNTAFFDATTSCPWIPSAFLAEMTAQSMGCTDARVAAHLKVEANAYAADESLGNLVTGLQTYGHYDRTLLVMASDNGGLLQMEQPNMPLRGGKQSFLEGGIRVRTAVGGGYMPSALHGHTSEAVSHFVDWWPTFNYLAGLDPYFDPNANTFPPAELPSDRGISQYPLTDGINMVPHWNDMLRGNNEHLLKKYPSDTERYIWHFVPETPPASTYAPSSEGIYTYVTATRVLKVYATNALANNKRVLGACPLGPLTVDSVFTCPYDYSRWGQHLQAATTCDQTTAAYPCGLLQMSCSDADPCFVDLQSDANETIIMQGASLFNNAVLGTSSYAQVTSVAFPRIIRPDWVYNGAIYPDYCKNLFLLQCAIDGSERTDTNFCYNYVFCFQESNQIWSTTIDEDCPHDRRRPLACYEATETWLPTPNNQFAPLDRVMTGYNLHHHSHNGAITYLISNPYTASTTSDPPFVYVSPSPPPPVGA